MIKNNKNFLFIIIFCIQTLSLIGLINSISIYVLEEAKEIPSSKNNILSFIIKSGVNEAINNDKYFKIDSEIYNNNEILKKSQIECTIPKEPNADFGTRIDIKCEIDLESTSNANKIKFLEFIPDYNDRDLTIIDRNNKILSQYLSFEKKAELKPDYQFVAESIKSIQCKENVLNFGIKGDIDKYWIKGFQFNLTWNENFPFVSQCQCPDIYFSSEVTINCTLEIKNNENFIYNLNKGILLKQKIYEAIDKDNKKVIVKISIKENKPELELKELNCDFGSYRQSERNDMDYNRKSNRGSQYEPSGSDKTSEKNQEEIDKEEENQKRWEREKEEEKRRKKEEEDREKEEEKRRKEQQDYQKYMREREREKEEEERRRRKEQEDEQRQREDRDRRNQNSNYYNNYNNNDNYNNRNDFRGKRNYENENDNNNYNNYNRQRNRDRDSEIDDKIDYNSNVKLLHLQIRYSYGFLYYMGYALTPIPAGHKIKIRLLISKYNQDSRATEQESKYIILKNEEEISPNDRNIIVEYTARLDCESCRKILLDKNSFEGVKIFNFPEKEYLLDALETNRNNYLQKNKMQSPPLYITENIYTQNCLINLGGNFFNRNRFFASKFALNLIGDGYNNNRNITVNCGLNERSIFSCPINENLNNFEYKLNQFIIDDKENIIIDNSLVTRGSVTYRVTCLPQPGSLQNTNNLFKNEEKQNDSVSSTKRSKIKKILIWIFILIVAYYVISKFCCHKEEEYSDEYNSRWRVSSNNYGGETYGLRSRGW